MTSISTPNWLAVAGLVYLAFAMGFALASLVRTGMGRDLLQRTRADAGRRVDALMAAPYLVIGACCLIAAQLVTASLTPSIVVLILSAPLALLLYMGFEGLWVEGLVDEALASPAVRKPMLRLPSPEAAASSAAPVLAAEPAVASELHRNGPTA